MFEEAFGSRTSMARAWHWHCCTLNWLEDSKRPKRTQTKFWLEGAANAIKNEQRTAIEKIKDHGSGNCRWQLMKRWRRRWKMAWKSFCDYFSLGWNGKKMLPGVMIENNYRLIKIYIYLHFVFWILVCLNTKQITAMIILGGAVRRN